MSGTHGGLGDLRIEVLTGSLAGETRTFNTEELMIGRDPDADLRFDPHGDLAVSGRHARLFLQAGRWILEDLGSLNGTILNGQVISRPAPLEDGDRVQFGAQGPTVSFSISPGSPSSSRVATPRVHGTLLALVAVLSLALAVVGVVAFHSWMEGRSYAEQVRAMRGQIDSILGASGRALDELRGRNESLADALGRSREDVETLRDELDAAHRSGDSGEIEILRVQLQEAQAALVRQQLAASMDFEAIEEANRRAVAKVFVDFGGEILTATAFSVRPDGLLITNRHVVAGASGSRRPDRIAIQFADSRQVWPARIVSISQADDLAALKVDNIVGDVPTVAGFNQRLDTVQSGQPVALLGFPLGGADPFDEGAGGVARTTMTAGILGGVSDGILEMDGYGVEGSSGSPVFDGSGQVVGVLFGGRMDPSGRTLFAVSADRALSLLGRVY